MASQFYVTKRPALVKLMQILREPTPRLVWIFGLCVTSIVFTGLSAIPWSLILLIVGRLTGPIPLGPLPLLLLLIAILLALLALLSSELSYRVSKKLAKNGIRMTVLNLFLSLFIAIIIASLFSFAFLSQVSESSKVVDTFVAKNANLGFEEYVNNVSSFLNGNIKNAYQKPEAMFRIDISISTALLDPSIMRISGITRGDVIVYQGWGTCEQAAVLIEELLRREGHQTRLAHSIGVDHEWAEVNHDGTWLIVDPWYITGNGTLLEARYLKDFNLDFQSASGVEVQYYDEPWVDASQEHGY
jgi:hypothetical protein